MLETVIVWLLAAGFSFGVSSRVYIERKTGLGTSEGWGETFFFSVLRAAPLSRLSPF